MVGDFHGRAGLDVGLGFSLEDCTVQVSADYWVSELPECSSDTKNDGFPMP